MYKTLVDTHTLALHLRDPDWVVVDCRFVLSDPDAGRRAYEAGHIPGARYAHLNDDLSAPLTDVSGRHPLPDPALLAARLGAWGIDNSRQVVVYDDSFGSMAGRLWWLLRWLGHDAVALLDGGLPKWQREGHSMSQAIPAVVPVTFSPHIRPGLLANASDVEKAVKRDDMLVIDARAEERFNGEIELLDKVAGHIPGAVNLPYDDNLHLSGTYSSEEELAGLYRGILGEVKPENTILMCGSGVTACHQSVAMARAGLKGARRYAGSGSDWITDERRPVARDD